MAIVIVPAWALTENKNWMDPDEMTPDERWDEILNLLAKAVVRLTEKEKAAGIKPPPKTSVPKDAIPMLNHLQMKNEFYIPQPKRGRMPFGEKPKGAGTREENLTEQSWMRKILEWSKEGKSLSKIMKRLNEEDRETRYAGKWDRAKVWWVLKRAK